MKSVWLWWSSGKDSAWALHVLRRSTDLEVTGLVTTVTSTFDRVSMHAVRSEILSMQARAVDLPLHRVEIPFPCDNPTYEAAVGDLLQDARKEGVDAMAFGDLFLEDVRAYRETLLADTGIEPLFPLWGEDTSVLARRMIAGGLKAVVTCVDPAVLAGEFAGRDFDSQLLADLPAGIDPCGERGEFHTCVTAGPMFDATIGLTRGPIERREGFVFADLRVEDAA